MPDHPNPFQVNYSADNIRGRMARMWLVSALGKSSVQLLHLAALMILARLLLPADFGLIAMIMGVIGIATIFGDMGLSAATVRARDISPSQASTLFLVNIVFGGTCTILVFLAAPLLATFFDDGRVTSIVRVLAWTFLISSLGTQHGALLRRRMKFAVLAKINFTSSLLGQVAAVIMALQGYGYWSLVAALLITHAAKTVIVWLFSGWRPGMPEFGREVWSLISFGGYLVVFSILGYVAFHAPNVLIGWRFDASEVGFYARAFVILLLLMRLVTGPLATVAPAALSRMTGEPEKYRETYLLTVSMMLLLTAPLGFFCAVGAADIIAVVLGGNWNSSVPILQVLALSTIPQSLCISSGWLYQSHGDTRRMMQWGIWGWSALTLMLLVGVFFGALGVAVSYSVGMFILLYPCMTMAFRRTSITFGQLMHCVLPISAAALLAILPVIMVQSALLDIHALFRLPLLLLVYGACYLLLLLLFGQRILLDSVRLQMLGRFA